MPHIGSWGLPDFGVTEFLGRQIARVSGGYAPLTSQLGSNLIGNQSQTTFAQNPSTGEVIPLASTLPPDRKEIGKSAQTTSAPTVRTTTPSSPSAPSAGTPVSQPQEDPMERIRREVESIYSPLMNYYSQAESAVGQEYERYRPELEQQYQTSLLGLETQKQRGERELQSQQEQAVRTREDALSAARRLYDELRMGGRQRFGGASSAGQAFTELTNMEQQRRVGNIWNLYQQAEDQINKYKANLIDQFQQAQKELELAKTSALNQAYENYQNRLQQIRSMRGETESAKAQTALQALYSLRDQVSQINLTTLNLAQQLAANRQLALNYVNDYASRVAQNIMGGRGTYESFGEALSAKPTTNLGLGMQTVTNTPYQGHISYKRPEDYLTAIGF